jgi:superoxide reductase
LAELNKTYKCDICGHVVKVLQAGIGVLTCCNQPMVMTQEEAMPPEPKEEMSPTPETPGEPKLGESF